MTDPGWDPTVDPDDGSPGVYDSCDEWVRDWLLVVVRPSRPVHWCARWWAHPEAASRLGALWAAWEVAELEGGAGPSHWWVYHFAGHWDALVGSTGPFSACTPTTHNVPPRPLATEPVPTPEGEVR